jgi:lipid II:glycine glycyltransferase (peptidoglycan interpeptide bridge formation enzyme)
MGANLTMALDLTKAPAELLTQMSRKWRRNLRIAEQKDLLVERDSFASLEALGDVFSQMARAKGIGDFFPSSELGALIKKHPDSCAVYTAKHASGELVAFRCILLIGSFACDYFAATTPRGRELRASYLLLWTALCDFHQQGIAYLDLGGIDPLENPGVYRFKKGTGATPIEILGEWDWATNTLLKWFANKAIGFRARVRWSKSFISRVFHR